GRAGERRPWWPVRAPGGRPGVVAEIAREQALTADLRAVMVRLLGDRSSSVRQAVIRALSRTRLAPSEAPAVEALLTRGAADLRRGALTVLASLPPDAARASAARLAASPAARPREAAPAPLRAAGPAPAGGEVEVTAPVDARARTAPLTPRAPGRRGDFGGGRAGRILAALDELAAEHRNTPVLVSSWPGRRQTL